MGHETLVGHTRGSSGAVLGVCDEDGAQGKMTEGPAFPCAPETGPSFFHVFCLEKRLVGERVVPRVVVLGRAMLPLGDFGQ